MISNFFSRSPSHLDDDPAQRVLAIAALAPDAEPLLKLLAEDAAAEVRIAAAQRCASMPALAQARASEPDAAVRGEIGKALVARLLAADDDDAACALLKSAACDDAIRAEVAKQASQAALRQAAMEGLGEEAMLIDVALGAAQAETRLAAGERVTSAQGLRRLAEAAKNRDHGVARSARQRLEARAQEQARDAEADAVIAQLESLALEPGPILSAVIDLNRRWQALGLELDGERKQRCDQARAAIQLRFEREQAEQRARAQLEREVEMLAQRVAGAALAELDGLRAELEILHAQAQAVADAGCGERLQAVAARLEQRAAQAQAQAVAAQLVHEAEGLAAGTSIDHAGLPERWQALAFEMRTPELTRRFEAALTAVEQRRLAQIKATQLEANAARAQLHALLHTAEQALAAGQTQAARDAADATKALKAGAGVLPKPTIQRLSRVVQQITDLERWESFGQHNARVQLCERAEAAAAPGMEPAQVAHEVQKLRNEWKQLDQQYAGVPKALWQRFDSACERAYAPAARHFSELAAKRKEVRRQREAYITGAAEQLQQRLAAVADWRAHERWLREIEHGWREGNLGSVDPATWKKLDQRFKQALAPLRDALAAERDKAKQRRGALIEQVRSLLDRASERDVPSQVKGIQAQWQAEAKALALAQRDERALWNEFRAACDAVFAARANKRKEDDARRDDERGVLRELCEALEGLAQTPPADLADLQRAMRELQEQWKSKSASNPAHKREFEARFRRGVERLEALRLERVHAKQAAVWQDLRAKERLCEELDRAANSGAPAEPSTWNEKWQALAQLPSAWEKKLNARWSAGLAALADAQAAQRHAAQVRAAETLRRDALLEMEMQLGLDSPAELQQQRLALQVKQLKDRFRGTAGATTHVSDRLIDWCSQAGVASAAERERYERIVARLERMR